MPPPANPAAPPTPLQGAESGEWTDEKLVDALKRLDDLHTKLINLRTVIPRLTLPLSTSHPSPAELYDDLSTRARGASEEVLAFNSLFVKSQSVFDHANASRALNPRGIQSVSVYDMFYVDEGGEEEEVVVEEVKKKKKKKKKDQEDVAMKDVDGDEAEEGEEGEEGEEEGEGEEEEEEEIVEETREEDVERVIGEFKAGREDLVVDVQAVDAGRVVKITLPSPSDLLFTIDIPSIPAEILDPSSAARRFIVTSIANTKHPSHPTPHLYTSILRSITTRPHAGNLQLLLEMLAEYTSIYTVACKKCTRMTGGTKVELPIVRRRDTVPVEAEDLAVTTTAAAAKRSRKKKKVWNAYHEVCV